jgi:putative ABC transport system ATP-binding protein
VLLADEPTGNLDKENSLIVFKALGVLAKTGLAVLVSTHDPLAAEFVSRTLPMSDGKILK